MPAGMFFVVINGWFPVISEFLAHALIRQYLMENKPIKLDIYIHASIVDKKQGGAVLIAIRCEKTRCEKKLIEYCF